MAMGASRFIETLIVLSLIVFSAEADGDWDVAHATFYGDQTAGEARKGACGYEDTIGEEGFGTDTAALSTVLFVDGHTCGSCYEMQCFNSTQCHPGTITITGTNFCPPNPALPSEAGGWCNPPRKHFDLTLPAYLKIGVYKAGIVPIQYRRIPCARTGGIKFKIRTDSRLPSFLSVLIYNVAGAGDISSVSIKGSNTDWVAMQRSWGVVWATGTNLVGQSLSFRVTTSDGKMVDSINVAPANWSVGNIYEGQQVS